jgi:monoamine oxidase
MSRSIFSVLAAAFEPAEVRLTRRQVLKAAMAAAAVPLLGSAGRARGAQAGSGEGIAVIGGGLSGLVCAMTLIDAGFAPLVMEPRMRAGGRVLSLNDVVAGKVVEAGGEFIGRNHATWLALAKRMDLELVEVPDEDLAFPMLINGETLDKKAAEALYEEMHAAFKTLTERARVVNEDEPWKTDKAQELDATSVADWWNGVSASDRCKRAIRAQLENDNGVALEKLSLLAMLAMIKGGGLEAYWTESEAFRCKDGNQRLATAMAGSLHGNRIVYNEPVLSVKMHGPTTVVATKSGRQVNAKHVVLAVPPSLWDSIEFDPPLPKMPVQMGTAVKLLSSVKDRYWTKAGRSGESLSDQAPGMTWDGTLGQAGDGACLTAFAGGPGAEKGLDAWKAKHEGVWHDELEKIQPGYSANVTATRFMGWPTEQWTRGGYSFPAPGQVTTFVKAMREQLGESRLWVCGEHTSSKFPGYMEGALESGVREANRIINSREAPKKPLPAPGGAKR